MSSHGPKLYHAARALAFVIASIAVVQTSSGGTKPDASKAPAVCAVPDQAAALQEAVNVDLPLLAKADKVIIAGRVTATKGDKISLSKADEIEALRGALKARQADPSGGIVAATLTFYQGGKQLRKVWVYEGGEWGFERPSTSWTTGKSKALWQLIQKHVK